MFFHCTIVPFLIGFNHPFVVLSIHETEIKQFGNRNGRNRVKIISTLGHKSRIVETDYEGRNELQGSKWIIKVEMDYVVRALTDWQLVINWRSLDMNAFHH